MSNELEIKSRRLTGVVVSASSNQTIKVEVRTLRRHPVYLKTLRHDKSYMVHDENNSAVVGSTVQIQECKPRSKTKSWELVTE